MPDRTHTSVDAARDNSLKGGVTRDPSRRGSTVVEFTLVFILFLVLLLGVVEIGGAVWTYTTVAFAARQGARFAMIHGSANPVLDGGGNDITDTQVEAVVQANAVGLDPSKIVVDPPTWTPDRSRGSIVELQVSYPYTLFVSPLVLPQTTLDLKTTARVVVAY